MSFVDYPDCFSDRGFVSGCVPGCELGCGWFDHETE